MEDEEPGERTPALAGHMHHSRTLAAQASERAHSASPRRVPIFERASARWWNPQFKSAALEAQYWKCSFPQLRDRFRAGLLYICFVCIAWLIFLTIFGQAKIFYAVVSLTLVVVSLAIYSFTVFSAHYQRFYMPTSFLCTFLICLVTLLIFSEGNANFMSPVATLAISIQVVLLIYTVIPLPLYLCVAIGVIYSILVELLCRNRVKFGEAEFVKFFIHCGIHMLGVHLFILTQVRQRKTFLKVGQSLMARKDLMLEKQFKDHMIQSVMPKKVADELLKDANELRRPSASLDSNCRTSNATATLNNEDRNVRKFRPFTMNLMTDVSILFADICGFTKMSSNKSADELVNLLNDLFGRFDNLCRLCGLEKISTLGDCYYCVAGCPEPCVDHGKRCVEMGLEMIVAIRQFDVDRGQEVNMRVGIHTGKVMCGMVGTKRFKFDVFSNDVTLANEMESSGQAGRVHISESTAAFLDNSYNLEEAPVYAGLKTYFIAGRNEANVYDGIERVEREIAPNGQSSKNVGMSFRKASIPERWFKTGAGVTGRLKIASKLKTIHTNSLPMRGGQSGGGSLRMKMIEKNKGASNSTQLLPKEPNSICVMDDQKKSASLQALTSNTNVGPYSSTGVTTGSTPDARAWNERSGAKNSGNGSSANSAKGSRSSGLQLSLQDPGSDLASVGGLDTAISHHHNAASLTRFDTDHRDFDQRLVAVIQIQGEEAEFAKGFWVHQDSLNRWTLRFNEKEIEEEYRAHFAESTDRFGGAHSAIAHHKNLTEYTPESSPYRYSGVFIDMITAGGLCLVAAIAVMLSISPIPIRFIIYTAIALTIVMTAIGMIGVPLLTRKSFLPCVNLWLPRHIIGLILIGLPVGVAVCIVPLCDFNNCPSEDLLSTRITFSYVMILALFAHCNFSQLGAWPKTLLCVVVGIGHVGALIWCQKHLDLLKVQEINCTTSNSSLFTSDFKSPLFLWEIVLDVLLAIILVAFLNYQFEAAFRMSFFGDVQARRDTEKMQIVRDQADWLLNNVIPPHAVETLKTDTKYSENHEQTAVLFASITNWSEMYEENFEGGREFLRVLNEVIGDFDELLDRAEFCHIEKIKTIGSTYMAASGLNPEKRRHAAHPKEHLYQMIEFALSLQHQLSVFNEDLLNFDFVCKLGLNIGPVTAGVIGTTKLYYDIWGDTVNISSRMYSTGVQNRLQVSKLTRDLLSDRYEFEFRGNVEVKGVDGGMETFLLVGRRAEAIPPVVRSADELDS
ncbi:unnamed protein product, partial [Mesorhabditis belari]|uniref:adenylate cyclase n=1 Tax=Mesorhabditis belari TaxID=2138241 RepID=A0AAF3E9D0_9BILA